MKAPSRFGVAVVGFGLVACAAPIRTSTSVTYIATVRPTVDTLAILPVSSGEGLEGFRRMISDSLFLSLKRAHHEIVLLPADTTLARLNVANLADKYAQTIRDYQQTSMLDKATLASMSSAIGARYLLYTRAAYNEGRSVGGNFFSGYHTQRNQDLSLFVHIWDGRQGDVVWEAVSGGKVEAGELETSRGVDEILSASITDLIGRFLEPPSAHH